jgi:putative ABC transport system permease protein
MNRWERRLYSALLLAFPRRVREEYGPDMEALFEAQLDDARRSGVKPAMIWRLALADAIRHGGAERAARFKPGLMACVREAARWRWWMRAFRQDIRYAFRMLIAHPGTTVVAVLTLALGIGANTAIFSAVNAVLLRPLPYPEPDRLVMIWEKRAREGVLDNVVAPADYLDWEQQQRSFEAIAGMTVATVDLTGAGEPARLFAGTVGSAFFDVLGLRPILGRTFRPEETTVGQHHVVILGDRLWRQRFRADPAIVGRKILLDQLPYEVVGVLPATFEFPDSDLELWVPLALRGGPTPPRRTLHYLNVYGRLKAGVTLDQARADMDRIAAQLSEQYPDANRQHGAHVITLREQLQGPVRSGLLTLLGAVAFVLLIGCVNVANLLLARAAARRREMAIRAAVGAGRSRIIGQALTESILLALLGGLAAMLVANWGIALLRQIAPADLQVLGASRVQLDGTVLAFTLALSVLTGLVFGILPAWQLSNSDVNELLKDAGRSPAGVRRRLRKTLVVSEIALASLLLVGAGLTLRSFLTVLRTDTGFRQDGLLTAFVSLPSAKYRGDAPQVAAYDEIERRLASLPGVRSVGATSHLPLSGADSRTGVVIEGREPTPDTPTRAHIRAVTLDYFRTMGMRLVAGRNFTASDHSESPFVAVINETMARRYWPGQSAIGRRFQVAGNRPWTEVVGIVADVKHWGFERPVNPEMYLPQKQMVWAGLTFVLATDVDPVTLTAAVRNELKAVDPDLPLSNVRTMEQVVARSVAVRRSSMVLLGVFGSLALILAAAGIYGVMAQLVTLRTGEIGIRMTLGAVPSSVMRLVLRDGLVQAALGLIIGLSAAIAVMYAFRSMLYEVSPADPLTLVVVAALLLATAVSACTVPARRAMRVDPLEALRS